MTKGTKRIVLGLFLAGSLLVPVAFGHGLAIATTRLLADGVAPPPPPPPWPTQSVQLSA